MMLKNLLDFLVPLIWVLLILAFILYLYYVKRRHGWFAALRSLYSRKLIVPLLVVLIITVLRLGLIFIPPQQIGVVISIFADGGIRDNPLPAGLHWVVPLAEQVAIYPIYVQAYTMSARPLEGAIPGNDAIVARTSDGQLINIDVTLLFRLNPDKVVKLHIYLQDRYINDLLRPAIRSIVRTIASQFTVDEVNSQQREAFQDAVNKKVKEASEDTGVIIMSLFIRYISFSTEYGESVEKKEMARQGMLQADYEAKQVINHTVGDAERIKMLAEAQANAIVVTAEADARARVVRAEADAEALRLVGESLNRRDDLLTFRYIEKLSPNIRAMLLPANAPLILPLPNLDSAAEEANPPELAPAAPVLPAAPPIAESPQVTPADDR